MNSRTAYWAELYGQGLSLRGVAAKVGVTHKAVLYAFRAEDVDRRPRAQAHNVPPQGNRVLQRPWQVGWCNECCEERKLNPKTGWCWTCSAELRSQTHPTPTTRPVQQTV
jgi:hypothetical protein